ncbi:hypothetical protein HDV00_011829 [Rhizophlyctis rosea]|nr:hypothetical protein HDV00_011829 [Rhizophlyctis rosea]
MAVIPNAPGKDSFFNAILTSAKLFDPSVTLTADNLRNRISRLHINGAFLEPLDIEELWAKKSNFEQFTASPTDLDDGPSADGGLSASGPSVHHHIVTIPTEALTDKRSIERVKATAAHCLKKSKNGAIVYKMDLPNDATGRELHFGFFSSLTPSLPSCELAFGVVLTGSDEELQRDEMQNATLSLVRSILDAMNSHYDMQLWQIHNVMNMTGTYDLTALTLFEILNSNDAEINEDEVNTLLLRLWRSDSSTALAVYGRTSFKETFHEAASELLDAGAKPLKVLGVIADALQTQHIDALRVGTFLPPGRVKKSMKGSTKGSVKGSIKDTAGKDDYPDHHPDLQDESPDRKDHSFADIDGNARSEVSQVKKKRKKQKMDA